MSTVSPDETVNAGCMSLKKYPAQHEQPERPVCEGLTVSLQAALGRGSETSLSVQREACLLTQAIYSVRCSSPQQGGCSACSMPRPTAHPRRRCPRSRLAGG